MAAVSLIPLLVWYRGGARGAPMFELISLSFGAQYALPLYLEKNQMTNASGQVATFDWGTTEWTLVLACIGIASLQIGFYGVRKIALANRVPQFKADLDDVRLRRYLFAAGMIGLLTLTGASAGLAPANAGPFGYFVRLLESQSTVAIALLSYRAFRSDRDTFSWQVGLWSWVTVAVVIGLASAALENALIPVAIVFVVRWETSKRLPWKALVLGALVFVLFDSVKAEYRAQIRTGTNSAIVQKAGLWYGDAATAVTDTLTGDVLSNTQARIEVAAGRLDLLHITALVEELTPKPVPYLNGRSYSYLGYSFIPRFVWPDKPATSDATNLLAIRYGLLTPSQLGENSVGIGHIAEGYANFGIPGVVLVLMLAGAIFAILERALNSASIASRALFIAVMIYFLNGIGTSTAVIFGGIVQNVLPGALIIWFFCRLHSGSNPITETAVATV